MDDICNVILVDLYKLRVLNSLALHFNYVNLLLFTVELAIYKLCVKVVYLKCMNCAGASAINKQLTWALYVLYAYPYSVSIMISVQPVGKCLFSST